MAKGTYQTYTIDTSIDDYRKDYLHRGAMCGALVGRYPALASLRDGANAVVAQIDARRSELQKADDDQVRARAVEDAHKLFVVESYTELRRTMFAKKIDVTTLLPDAPSILGRLGIKTFRARTDQAVSNLEKLSDTDPVKAALLPTLVQDLTDFRAADDAEDATRANLQSARVALTLYKTELSQAREAQLGAILEAVGDSEKMAAFALPWRKSGRATDEEPTPAPVPTPTSPE